MPRYARIAIPILLLILVGRLAWQGAHSLRHEPRSSADSYVRVVSPPPISSVPWQNDFFVSLYESVRDIGAGNITAAEVSVDRAESILTAARLQSQNAQPDFFTRALASLDGVIASRPDDARIFDHVTDARISLAELRSSLNATALPPSSSMIRIAAPRPIAANDILNPRSLGSNFLDATLMPDTSEVLLPPTSRLLDDNISVENLTISGAAQTLDGIRWRNVTFLGTRLRYEGGALDLENVHFVRCRFGLFDDESGARLATALALGQSSIAIR
jgi:hypothetical protein